jgi:hypothetical protein
VPALWKDKERLNKLALLLENVGLDAAVSLGNPELWKQAIDKRLKKKKQAAPEGVEDADS